MLDIDATIKKAKATHRKTFYSHNFIRSGKPDNFVEYINAGRNEAKEERSTTEPGDDKVL